MSPNRPETTVSNESTLSDRLLQVDFIFKTSLGYDQGDQVGTFDEETSSKNSPACTFLSLRGFKVH
jgi:hypothetical protein